MAQTYPGSTTDHAAQLRAALKARGWTGRDVSVRADSYSMGSSIRVVIKNPAVPLAAVQALAQAHERVDRDQWGEILSGGNRFVDVSYSPEALAALADRQLLAVFSAAARLDSHGRDTRVLEAIGETGYLLGRGYHGWGYSLYHTDRGHVQRADDLAHLASHLAIALQAA